MKEIYHALEAGAVELLTPIQLHFRGELMDLTTQFDNQDILHASKQKITDGLIETTVGRAIFNDHLFDEMPYINGLLKKKGLQQLVNYCYLEYGHDKTVNMLDELKNLGFYYAMKAGFTIGVVYLIIPESKEDLVERADGYCQDVPGTTTRARDAAWMYQPTTWFFIS